MKTLTEYINEAKTKVDKKDKVNITLEDVEFTILMSAIKVALNHSDEFNDFADLKDLVKLNKQLKKDVWGE